MKQLYPKNIVLLLSACLLVFAACAAPAAAPAGDTAAEETASEEAAAAPDPETGDAAAEPGDEADAMSDTLVIAISEDTASLDPARSFETLPSIIHKATYQTLVTFPADSVETVIPSLAETWEISDDGTTYTFALNAAATFFQRRSGDC